MLSKSDDIYLRKCAHAILKRTSVKKDGKGFSSYDITIVRGILSRKDKLTHPQANTLKNILIKYRGQIDDIGFSVDRVRDIDTEVHESGEVKLWFEGDDADKVMAIKSPYDIVFVESIKELPPEVRRWNKQRRLWLVDVDYIKKYITQALGIIQDVYNVNFNIEIPDVVFGKAYVKNNSILWDVGYDEKFVKKIKEMTYCRRDECWITKAKTMDDITIVHEILDTFDVKTEGVYSHLQNAERMIEQKEVERDEAKRLLRTNELEAEYHIRLPSDAPELYPFQRVGVRLLDLRGKALLSDEMGLGKSCQTLAHLNNNPSYRPVLIISPSSVKINWKREIIKWTHSNGDDVCIVEGRTNNGLPQLDNWFIINYAIVHHRLEDLFKLNFGAIIIDESHYIKNHDSKRTEAVSKLCHRVEHIYCLSGTPMPNKPIELYSQLSVLNITSVPEFNKLWGKEGFAQKYCGAFKKRTRTKEYWDLSGATNLDELQTKLEKYIMIRRKKENVLKELPNKRRMMISVDIENRDDYNNVMDELRKTSKDKTNYTSGKAFGQLEKLRDMSWKGKIVNVKKWIDDAVGQYDKIVVWAHHKELQRNLYNHYEDIALHLTGGMTSKQRQDIIDEFTNNDNIKVCVASMKSAGVGINLQISSCAIFTELLWSPADHKQCEDRVHRIGQESDTVEVYYLIANRTIEEEMFKIISHKQRLSDEAIDGAEVDDEKGMKVEVLKELIGDE